MQRCPKCNRTYQDDKQKFCTHDGGRLEPYAPPLNEAPTSFDLGATMRTDSSDLGETLLDKAAELNKTMAAPPPPPPSPQLSKTIAVPSPPKVTPAAAAPPPPPPQPPPSQPPQNKTVAAPPPQSPPAGGIRPTGTMPGSSQTSELPRPQETTGFPPPASGVSQPSGWPPAPPPPATASTPHRQPVAPPLAPGHITQPVQKPNRLPLVIGGIVVLLLLAVGASVIAYMMYSRKSEPKPTNEPGLTSNISTDKKDVTNANANTAGNANSSTSKFEAPPNSLKFVNSRADLDGKLAEHYADFSFYYPRLWTLDPKSGVPGASNFVKVDRIVPPDFKQESFAVGWYDSKGMMTADRAIFPNLVSRFNAYAAERRALRGLAPQR